LAGTGITTAFAITNTNVARAVAVIQLNRAVFRFSAMGGIGDIGKVHDVLQLFGVLVMYNTNEVLSCARSHIAGIAQNHSALVYVMNNDISMS
jgi:hypothetical protein